ncbi:uncharacterized protein LOC124288546 isoform X2 [Haliotis rubra]|nr:uncharacterized protein LOC124288546 isoform X2 [Haliotis rubra]
MSHVTPTTMTRSRPGKFDTDAARWSRGFTSGKHVFEIVYPSAHRGSEAPVGVGAEIRTPSQQGEGHTDRPQQGVVGNRPEIQKSFPQQQDCEEIPSVPADAPGQALHVSGCGLWNPSVRLGRAVLRDCSDWHPNRRGAHLPHGRQLSTRIHDKHGVPRGSCRRPNNSDDDNDSDSEPADSDATGAMYHDGPTPQPMDQQQQQQAPCPHRKFVWSNIYNPQLHPKTAPTSPNKPRPSQKNRRTSPNKPRPSQKNRRTSPNKPRPSQNRPTSPNKKIPKNQRGRLYLHPVRSTRVLHSPMYILPECTVWRVTQACK